MLEFNGVKVCASGGKTLLRGAYLSLRTGVVALSGTNGAGKSTLLRAIAGLHDIDAGQITMGGLDTRRHWAEFRSMMSYMPQNFTAFRDLTGREFMQYLLGLRGVGRRQAEETAQAWLARVGLAEVADNATASYSQGMLQRLGFACAVQVDVALYLLDEPFAGVDPETRTDLMRLLVTVTNTRLAVVVTHEVDEMVAAGAKLVQLVDGALVEA